MIVLKILAIIILICILIGMIRLGVSFDFVDEKLRLSLILAGLHVQVIPSKKPKKEKKPKEPKPEKPVKEEKPKKEKKPKQKKKKASLLHITFDDVIAILKKVIKGLGKVTGGFQCSRFLMHLTVAGKDPYDTAVAFGRVNAALNILAPMCDERFRCRDVDVWTDMDFQERFPRLDLGADITIRIHCFFRMLNTIVFGVLGVGLKNIFRNLWFKITDRKEYEYEAQLRLEKSEKLHALIDSIKNKKNNKADGEADSDNSERTN